MQEGGWSDSESVQFNFDRSLFLFAKMVQGTASRISRGGRRLTRRSIDLA